MSSFMNFGAFDTSDDNLFNAPTDGGGFLGEGEHTVKITEIKPYAENNSLLFKFETVDKKYISSFIKIRANAVDSDGEIIRDKLTSSPSRRLAGFLTALLGTTKRAKDYLSALAISPQMLQALTGMTISVVVTKGVRGYNVVPAGGGQLQLVDAGEGLYTDIISGLSVNSFESYNDIKDFVAQHNGSVQSENQLKRAYNNIKFFNRGSQEEVDGNVAALQIAKEAGSSVASSVGSTVDISFSTGTNG